MTYPPNQPSQPGGYSYDPYGGGQQPSPQPSPQPGGYNPGYGQQPQPQPGYPAPQMPPAVAQPQYGTPIGVPENGLGNAALVLGILGLVTGWIPVVNYFTWIMSLLAIIFGAIGISKANKGRATNKGMAITGLVLGCVAFALVIVAIIVVASFLASVGTTTY